MRSNREWAGEDLSKVLSAFKRELTVWWAVFLFPSFFLLWMPVPEMLFLPFCSSGGPYYTPPLPRGYAAWRWQPVPWGSKDKGEQIVSWTLGLASWGYCTSPRIATSSFLLPRKHLSLSLKLRMIKCFVTDCGKHLTIWSLLPTEDWFPFLLLSSS